MNGHSSYEEGQSEIYSDLDDFTRLVAGCVELLYRILYPFAKIPWYFNLLQRYFGAA